VARHFGNAPFRGRLRGHTAVTQKSAFVIERMPAMAQVNRRRGSRGTGCGIHLFRRNVHLFVTKIKRVVAGSLLKVAQSHQVAQKFAGARVARLCRLCLKMTKNTFLLGKQEGRKRKSNRRLKLYFPAFLLS
jgi:hypothetical protein